MGLLLLRVVAGIALVFQAATALCGDPSIGSTTLYVLTGVVGVLLLIGLWTPVAGTVLAVLASSSAFLHWAEFLSLVPFRGSRCCFGTARTRRAGRSTPTCLDGSASSFRTERASPTLIGGVTPSPLLRPFLSQKRDPIPSV